MGTDFNGGQINTTVTDVDSLPLLLSPLCTALYWWSEAQAHGLDVRPIKTYSQTKVLYPAALWAGAEEYASSPVYFIQPLPAALLYPNHRFLTPCYHFLVRALTPPSCLHPSVLFAQIDHPPAASRCFWVASLSRRQRMPSVPLAAAVNNFVFLFFFVASLCTVLLRHCG